jgi:hypothetical protein
LQHLGLGRGVSRLIPRVHSLIRVWKTHLADVTAADADDLGTRPDRRDVRGYLLRLLDAAADDAGVCAEADERPGLHAADCAGAARHEDDTVVWMRVSWVPSAQEREMRESGCVSH